MKHIESANVATRKVLVEKTEKPKFITLSGTSLYMTGSTSIGYILAPYIIIQNVEPVIMTSFTGAIVLSGSTTIFSQYAETAVNPNFYGTIKFDEI